MRALRLASAFVLALVGAVALAGCGPGFDSLGQGFRNPLGYGVCGIVWLVLNVIAMLEILRSSRDTVSKIVWLLALWFLPFVGLIAYYLFGRRR